MKIIQIYLKKLTVISALRASSENELKVRFCKIDEVLFGDGLCMKAHVRAARPAHNSSLSTSEVCTVYQESLRASSNSCPEPQPQPRTRASASVGKVVR